MVKEIDTLKKEFLELKKVIKEYRETLDDCVCVGIANDYAKFCIMCDRENLPSLCLEDFIKIHD